MHFSHFFYALFFSSMLMMMHWAEAVPCEKHAGGHQAASKVAADESASPSNTALPASWKLSRCFVPSQVSAPEPEVAQKSSVSSSPHHHHHHHGDVQNTAEAQSRSLRDASCTNFEYVCTVRNPCNPVPQQSHGASVSQKESPAHAHEGVKQEEDPKKKEKRSAEKKSSSSTLQFSAVIPLLAIGISIFA